MKKKKGRYTLGMGSINNESISDWWINIKNKFMTVQIVLQVVSLALKHRIICSKFNKLEI